MREMKSSGIPWIGEIPKGWKTDKIKYTLEERIEKNSPVKTTNILSLTAKQGVIPYGEKEGGGNKPKEDVSEYHLAYPGDIVMNSMNILSGSVGLSKYFGCVSPVYYMLRPKSQNEDVRFYNYIFQTEVFQKSLFGLGNGILIKESANGKFNTIRMRIPMDKFRKLYLPVAPVHEQHRIADYLDTKCARIDSIKKNVEAEIEALKQYKKSVITEAVTKGLDKDVEMKDSGSQYWGEIPQSWNIVDIKYLFQIMKRIAGREGYDVLSITQHGIKVRDVTIIKGQLANDYSNYQLLYPGEFAMNHMDLLTGWVDLSDKFGVTSPDYRVFRLRDTVHNSCRYYKYVMQVCYMCRIFYSLGSGVANLGRWRLQTPAFNNFKVPVPSYEEQEAIANYLDNKVAKIDSIIQKKQEMLANLDTYKKSLIYEYVTGKKEVPAV